MNKKGYAVLIVVYAIILLVVSLLYMLLGIMRNRYSINDDLRKSIINNLNNEEYLKLGDELFECEEEIEVSLVAECTEENNGDEIVKCLPLDDIYEKHVYKNVCIQDENLFTN